MRAIRFDAYEFDPVSGELTCAGARVRLQEQPARALAYLIEHADRTVTRSELIRHLWADGRHVQFDQGLNYCIRRVRIALGDGVASPRYLSTVGRRGYRWIGPLAATRWRVPFSIASRVPAWMAVAPAAACVALSVLLLVNRAPAPLVLDDRAADLRTAIHAVHVLSHALIEPGRAPDRQRALLTLRSLAARVVAGS